MDDDALAAALATSLSAVVPSWVRVEAVGRDIRVSSHDRRDAFAGVEVNASDSRGIDELDETALLMHACLQVLDEVQDFIAFETSEPWPGQRAMPEPVVEVTEDSIGLSFRDSRVTVLELPPIARTP